MFILLWWNLKYKQNRRFKTTNDEEVSVYGSHSNTAKKFNNII